MCGDVIYWWGDTKISDRQKKQNVRDSYGTLLRQPNLKKPQSEAFPSVNLIFKLIKQNPVFTGKTYELNAVVGLFFHKNFGIPVFL